MTDASALLLAADTWPLPLKGFSVDYERLRSLRHSTARTHRRSSSARAYCHRANVLTYECDAIITLVVILIERMTSAVGRASMQEWNRR
jgi:hypothetical protein